MPATAPLDRTQTADELDDVLDRAEAYFGHLPNLVRTLASNPAMCRTVTDFLIQSLGPGRLDWGFKELVILKTLRASGSHYSYGAHERLAAELGVPEAKIGDVAHSLWQTSEHFTDGERTVFALVEQTDEDANAVPDALWEELRTHWDNGQLLEANAVITTFLMIGRVGDALGIAEPTLFKRPVADVIADAEA
ncbi:MAG: carboxymuconolactone decarboxylase family protein [Salinibacter sp.]|uniref:carboxymuconolactone decarboxylase family protein n=1 Tax=Salinibacter sp. TaxID=2065818 RepID=UPI002FC38276